MKDKYWLFCGQNYYALGGFHDFVDSSDDLKGLIAVGEDGYDADEWWHVVDSETFEIVAGSKAQAHGACDLD